jgi:hypothetical protein
VLEQIQVLPPLTAIGGTGGPRDLVRGDNKIDRRVDARSGAGVVERSVFPVEITPAGCP